MTAVLTALWTFLSSPTGIALTTAGLGYAWRLLAARSKTGAQMLDLARQTFDEIEIRGVIEGLSGDQKWKLFVSVLCGSLQAQGLPLPSGPQMEALRLLAEHKSWLAKEGETVLPASSADTLTPAERAAMSAAIAGAKR
jgi:hypothetical protein